MTILAIDTSGQVCSVALVDEDKVIGEYSFNYKKTHSMTLMPMIDSLLQTVEIELRDVDYIACASGPGSFTGLRIGAATAKALAHGADKRIVQVPTLDALAYNIFSVKAIIVPMMDARRNQVYTSFYRWEDNKLARLSDYMAEDVNNVLATAKEYAQEYMDEVILTGDGVPAHLETIKATNVRFLYAPANMNRQRAASVGAMAIAMLSDGTDSMDYREFLPFYIRKPQAQREYERKHGND